MHAFPLTTRSGATVLVLAVALAGGCGDGELVDAPPPVPLAEGRVDPGPPSAIKASTSPSRRLEDPGPRSAVGASIGLGGASKRSNGSH